MTEPHVSPPPAAPPFVPKPRLVVAAYIAASFLLSMAQGLGMNLVSANLPQVQGAIGATSTEATWLIAAYMAPNVSLALALIKIRYQFGLRNFAELSILAYVGVALLNLLIRDLQSATVVRFMSGVAAAPMSSLAFLYMLEPFPPAKKLSIGVSLALTNTALAMPIARLISPPLIDIGGFHTLAVLELGLALMAFCPVYLLPLTPPPRAMVIGRYDVLSYLLIAVGLGATAVVLTLGRLYWWLEAPWLGALLALAVVCLAVAAAIELNRPDPLVDIRWISSPAILHFAAVLLVFRVVLAEQTTGANGFFTMLGLQNEQMRGMYLVVLFATLAGGVICAATLKPGREPFLHAPALALLAVGAWLDSHATAQTRPEEMYLSQAMIALASGLFLPPAMARGLMTALARGPNYILSFIIVFLTTQSLGALLGSAVFGTFITLREQYHSNMLTQGLSLSDPLVAQRITQLGGAYARVLTDPSLRAAEGVAALGRQATLQANVLAYNDAFLVISAVAALALAALLVHIAYDALKARLSKPSEA